MYTLKYSSRNSLINMTTMLPMMLHIYNTSGHQLNHECFFNAHTLSCWLQILCPKCSVRLGSFNWAGEQCSCSQWVVPSLQIHMSKIDETLDETRTLTKRKPVVKWLLRNCCIICAFIIQLYWVCEFKVHACSSRDSNGWTIMHAACQGHTAVYVSFPDPNWWGLGTRLCIAILH